jgi:endoglucanase
LSLALLVSPASARNPEPLKIVGTLKAEDWEGYRSRFVEGSGRVVDDANGRISHSEGQGYGLLLALAANDRRTFEQIWTFTKTEFLIRDDGLAVWKWNPSSTPPVQDSNNASDGDILIGYALARAGAAWNEPRFVAAARGLVAAIGKHMLREQGGRLVLLPGASGFTDKDRPDGTVVNLSYWVFEAFPVFATLDPDHDWQRLGKDGLALLAAGTRNAASLPPDWLALPRSGNARPAEGFPPTFGYNALRIPLYLIRAGLTDVPWLKVVRQRWAGGIAVVDVATGSVQETLPAKGYGMLASLIDCAASSQRLPAEDRTLQPDLYYPSTLKLLALSAVAERYPRCL